GLLELVEVELLRHHPETTLEPGGVAIQVVAEHVHRAAGLVHQRGKNADGGGLAGTIGAQQCVEVALGHVQIDAFQRLEAVTVNLGQLSDRQSGSHRKCTQHEKDHLDEGGTGQLQPLSRHAPGKSFAPRAALVWFLCRSKLDLSGWRGQAALPALRHGLWEISAPTLLIKAPIENPSAEPAAHDRRNVASQRSMSPDK